MDYDFEWDEDNELKLLLRHHVRAYEVEEVFYNGASVRRDGDNYLAMGQTDAGRWLLVVFQRKGTVIRAYSSRDLSEREKRRVQR
jgi:uncharacterized DUF497 family protein